MGSRSPAHLMPWWVLIWIQDSPAVFLVFSVACFSAGLVLLPYSLSQVSCAREYSCMQDIDLLSEPCHLYHRNTIDGLHIFRFHCRVHLDGPRALGLYPLQRPEMACRCAAGGQHPHPGPSDSYKERKQHRWHIAYCDSANAIAWLQRYSRSELVNGATDVSSTKPFHSSCAQVDRSEHISKEKERAYVPIPRTQDWFARTANEVNTQKFHSN
jgi:hypothetical protein